MFITIYGMFDSIVGRAWCDYVDMHNYAAQSYGNCLGNSHMSALCGITSTHKISVLIFQYSLVAKPTYEPVAYIDD